MTKQADLAKDTYVFLGPSLSHDEAKTILPANYLGPIAQGDILGLLWKRPHAIVIIDGYFSTIPAVWHKEIMVALSQGIRVYGAASMGALRATELANYGMVGHGLIYDWYASGKIFRDDEVALIHGTADENFRNLSLPLVNVRATLDRAVELNLLTAAEAALWLEVAANFYYPERSWNSLITTGKEKGLSISEDLENFFRSGGVNQKAEDVRSLLKLLAKRPSMLTPLNKAPDFELPWTIYLDGQISNDITFRPGCCDLVSPQLIYNYERLSETYIIKELHAQIECLVDVIIKLLDWHADSSVLAEEAHKFWEEQNIHSPIGIRKWLEINQLSIERFEGIIARRHFLKILLSLSDKSLPYYYLDILRISNELPTVLKEITQDEELWQSKKMFIEDQNISDDNILEVINLARKIVHDTQGQLSLKELAEKLNFNDGLDLINQVRKITKF